ncbi:uncharacterized protein LOC126756866 isoform X5 [Bactrocera neohumeralis]|uniref:uncharacterized protein LOC126756866 isoform X5 n=1 Tax=Bactrocera neohumeralis TaxID=98809 RepID=UPI0021667496|nr:uncharacterized protein LOC126756866 isoform X5 [Bactrocera neohumeralis]
MPNYRQKNKRNKNKNRQKNQQQQQQQQQQQNKNKNQNLQEPEIQQTDQNRQPTNNQDNQSQGQSRREQSNQHQQQQPTTSPQSPKSPTPTATQTTPAASEDEPRTATSPQQQPPSSEDAREVDSDVPAAALNQCHNLNSNEPTTSHQTFTTAVEREECNRVEDADAQLSKLDNKEATHSDIARIEEIVGAECDSAVQESTMGNKDSKSYITSDDDAATTTTAATTATVTASTDLCGISRPDRTIAGARELDELHTAAPKTQMAKVIVHRIVRETTSEGGENEPRIGDIDKVEQVASVGEQLTSGKTGELKVEVMDEQKTQVTATDGQIEGFAQQKQVQSAAKEVETMSETQQPKVIVHKIEQKPVEAQKANHKSDEPKIIVHAIQQEEDDLTIKQQTETFAAQTTSQMPQSNAGAKVIVHKIAQTSNNNAGPSQIQRDEADNSRATPANSTCVSPKGRPEQIDDSKVIIHHIQLESTSPINYRVDSPDTDSPTSQLYRSKQAHLLNKSIVQIQELSDESSSEYNDNPPVISEAESETESTAGACALDYAQAVRTLSPDSEVSYEVSHKPPAIPSQEQQDLKQRRAQKRVALETHFLPQLLSPRYLDSIMEENSDMSDARSDCSENPLMTTHSGDDLHDATASKVRKANEVFPRSNLDFTRRHAKKQLGALPKKPLPIREEPVAMVVAAKLIDNAITPAQECCTRLSSEHTPESEAAEVIYLSSSASSSLSDLMELDAEGDGDDECGNSSRSTIDLDTDAREIITRPGSEECAATASDSRESTPVNQASTRLSENNETQKIHTNNNNNASGWVEQTTPAAAAVNGTNIDTAKITNPIEHRIFENLKSLQLLAEPSGERTLSNGSGETKTSTTTTSISKRTITTHSESETETETSSETTTERCEYLRSSSSSGSGNGSGSSSLTSSIDAKYPPAIIATSDSLNVDPAVLLENIELEMNSVRDILNSHTIETTATTCGNQHVSDTRTSCELKNIDKFNSAKNVSPSPPPIPPPPTSASASDFHSDFTGFQTQSAPQPPPPIPARAPQDNTFNSASTFTTEQKSPQTQTTNTLSPNTHNALTTLSLLSRQESAESHCSDSTQHSQCTAINVGSRPSTDHELTPPLTAISPISDAQQQRQHTEWKYGENSESDVNTRGQQNDLELPSAEQKDAAIKKLRLLCTETLASMPYGEQVLVELATVAQNIGELQAKAPTQTPAEKSSALPQGTTHATNMPYPLPQLPHISELQLSIAADDRTPTTLSEPKRAQASHSATSSHTTTTHNVAITQRSDPVGASRDLTAASAKLLHSPPPPPVPVPPARYSDAPWLGVPTAADPNVLVCLSPAQQQQLTSGTQSSQQAGAQQTPQPDQLLDAHQKFLERRGYHEYTDEQVKSLNAELQQEEQQILKTAAYMKKLRKSLTPPPPPVPPPPVPAKNAETAAKAQNQARIAASSSHVSSDHSQRVYDVIQDRNANEQIAATFANGEQQRQQIQANQSEQKRLLTLTQKADASADAVAVSVDGSSSTTSSAHQQTSSLENNSRQTSAADAAAATAAAQGGAPAFAGKQPTASADTRQYSNANASASTSISRVSDLYAANNYTKNSFPTTATTSTSSANMQGVESELAKMFPTMGSSDIFDSNRKRFSNIESSTTSKDGAYCAQLQSTLPKRYSNIETHSYEAKKRMENGQVVYDYSDSRHERQSDGDKSLESASTPSLLQFPVREPSKEYLQYPVAGDGVSSRSGNSEIMSAIKLNTTENAKTTTQETNVETKEQTNGINMTNFVHPAATSNATATSTTATTQHNPTDRTFGTTATTETTIKEEHIKNSQEFGSSTARPQASSGGGDSGNAYEEFRQRAKAAADGGALGAFGGQTPATAPPLGQGNSKHSAFNFQHDKLFKDFDALSQQLHMELEEGKAQRQQREKSASLFDLNRSQWNFKDHFDELKQQRHQHMQELEREIERSMRSRQLKGWANGGAQNTTSAPTAGRTYEIPIQIEQNNGAYDSAHSNGFARKSDRSSAPRELTQPRAYNIPIVMENGDAPVPPPPPADYDTVDDASRFRRAESMFNLSENTRRAQPQTPQTYATYERPKSAAADDWARYASDFGSSENITRPFAREVEICYQRQRPRTIRAPRLSASTNDLSSYTHSYDNYNAYNARRSHAPMLQPVAQQQRPHHGSCYSVLERDPNPTYISTTTRRGVSPAPVSPAPQATAQEPLYSPHAPERQRRASLPREIQEQQLKYISSKEEELRMEFERLQNERRRLMEELNTPPAATLQMPQHPMRDIYRPVPKLPTLTEDEVFRQQMAEEWLSKVAEREERRLQKIIKISKVNETQQGQQPPVPPQPKTDISDEFLKRVQERRTKLAMPADSDWESGAESQPARAGHASESDAEVPPVKVIEGKSEADLRQLPRHLREFARFSNHNEEKIDGGHRVVHQEEERRQEANGNSMSSALKKSSVVKTVKIARPEIVTNTSQRVAPPPVSVQQHQQPRQQPQQGHSRPVSGGETVVTRRSHISTASSSTRSSYETHTKLQQSSISSTGGAAGGAMGGANHQQQPHSHLKHHNHQQQHQHHHHHQHSHSHKASSSSSRPPAPHVRTCKKTRFLLEPNRRSWSESDLLKEIDSELKLAKGFLYANARPQLKATGYQSEPEPNYDSDYSTVKYRTLDRRRLQSVSSATNVANRHTNTYQDDKLYGTMPNPIKSEQNQYKNQPGRIEDYVTGRSSVSEKERKEWWDEVMDIFNGWLREHRVIPRIFIEFADDANHLEQTKLSPHYTEGNLSRALAKESGYASDSNLVFRKRDVPQASPLSPVEQKQAYKSVQAGGEPPLFGFRKPAPERPKEIFDYTQISPTLTRIRVISTAPACDNTASNQLKSSQVTHQQATPPQLTHIKVHHQAKMFTPSFIPLGGKRASSSGGASPPQPPNRKSSCQKATAKTSPARPPKPTPVIPKRHEQCFQSPEETVLGANKYATITLRKHGRVNGAICRSKSAGAVSTLLAATKSSTETPAAPRALSICRDVTNGPDGVKLKRVQQHMRFRSISPTRSQSRVTTLRQSSRSPVAFGRSISKERTFAEEKKRLENTLPTALTNFEASTNILRDPSLKSPQEVKQAVRSYATCVAHLRSKSLPRLREEVKKTENSSVSTTVRHSMCFPQAKIFDCAKAMRKSLTRSKSPRPKTISTVSLARTDSTFSIESTTPKNVSRTNLVVTKRVAPPKSKPESKPVKTKSVTQQNGKRVPASAKGNTIPKAVKTRSSLKTQTSPTATTYKRAEDSHTIPRSGYQSITLHQSRSLSPKRYYHLEEYNARLDDYDVVDRSYVDDLLWQYERSTAKRYPAQTLPVESTARDIARPESPTPSLKHRKFSPTREVRVPQELRSLQVSYSKTESPRGDPDVARTVKRTSRFSPTREVRMPNLPPSLQPIIPRSKSARTVRDIARPESPAITDNTRRFSPTREVRVPQPPQSLPPPLLPVSSAHAVRVQSPSRDANSTSRKFSPTREIRVPPQQSARSVRSPSRRRIDTYRASTTKSTDKYDGGKVLRASSLSSADDRTKRGLYLCGELAHSATSLEHYERHSPTCRYRNNSERFTELNRFYSTLERVGQLERATSLSSFKPIRREGEPLDFDEWRKIRHHERAEKELNYLVGKLKHEQRTKDFVFRPKDVEDVKWRQDTDFGLHSKDKSVEDLRYSFEQKNIFADYEQKMRQEFDGSRDIVRPYWRRNTVADLASSLEGKIQPYSAVDHMTATVEPEELAKCQLSSRLVSTLSKDQILKITQQLNEIYSNNTLASSEDYVITVDEDAKRRAALPGALKVRCNSTLTKEELLKPTISKKLAKETTISKEYNNCKPTNESTSKELTVKSARSSSPVYLARETRGAVAAKNAEVFMPKPPPIPEQPQSVKLDRKTTEHREHTKVATEETRPFRSHVHYEQSEKDIESEQHKQGEPSPSGKEPKEKITQKIQYFEERQYDEPPKTIYHAREDSSPDEAEVMKVIEENMKSRARKGTPTPALHHHKELSHSLTDLKEIFGERHTARVNFHMHSPPERPPDVGSVSQPMSPVRDCMDVTEDAWYDLGELTPNSSAEQLDVHYRSRSISPVSQASSSYLCRVHTGDVRKMKERFESFGAHDDSRCHFFGVSTLRKVRSDPELKQFNAVSKDALKMETTNEEYGDVQALAHKFEQRSQSMRVRTGSGRGRTPYRRVISPIGVRDRLMPHIDIISKTAALKENKHATAQQRLVKAAPERSFVVEKIRSQYERSLSPPIDVFKSRSSPDIPQAAAISPHLSADWTAHKYPSPTQNAFRGNGSAKPLNRERTSVRIAKILRRLPPRSSSASPPRPPKAQQHTRDTSLRRMHRSDIFANQQFDPKKHQPKARYVPDGAEASERKRASSHPRCGGSCEILKSAMAVSFQESPNRYLESDVNIHFKTPIRHEYKQAMSDEDLAQRQAEQMQKLYQEERRRKYLQELQDMNARRHTDNFTPTQKSPIPLNRYDDFQSDLAPKSPNAITTRTAARALYNFQGQNARELTFKKGDIIYIRRQIDRNWYEGEFNAMIGLLPVSYVEVVNKETARQQPKKPSEGQARAKYNFQAQSGIELSLNKGELVTLTRRVDDNWFEGKIANRKGIFPVSYVEVLTDIGAEDIAARTVITEQASVTNLRPSLDTLRTNINNEFNLITKNGHQPPNGILKETKHHNNKIDALHVDTHSEPLVYRALYKYRPQNSDEMELLEGDIVHVLEICDDGWFVGTSQRTGCFGTFPGNYVERVR